jgi:AcrR family transcriptional regulator
LINWRGEKHLEIKIINATIDIFREKGVKFTMDDIANKLSVSKRTLYENIDSKEKLLDLLVDEVFDSIKEQGKMIIADDSIGDLQKLKRLLTIIPTSYNTIDYTKIHEINKFYPNIYEKIINRLETGWEPTKILINNCIEKGIIKKVNLSLMKRILIGSIRTIIEDNNLHKENLDYEESMKKIVDIMFDGLVIK